MEFVKYLRADKVLTEAMSQQHVLEAGTVKPDISMGDAIARLAVVEHKIRQFEKQFYNAKLALARPALGSAMTEKSTTLQTVIVSKDNFSKSEAVAIAKRNDWGSTPSDETGTSYRFRQHDPGDCQEGSLRTITLKEGVKGVVCKLKGGTKSEQANQRTLFEAGDYSTVGGHTVYVDDEAASEGDMSGVEKQIKAHNRFRSDLEDADFKKSSGAGWGQGETHSKDAGNGYQVQVSLHGGKAHTTVTNRGAMVRAVGSASSSPQLSDHMDQAMAAAKNMPPLAGYESANLKAT
jgi:hypothetical protein